MLVSLIAATIVSASARFQQTGASSALPDGTSPWNWLLHSEIELPTHGLTVRGSLTM